jgi:gliding motility associated protien GldN
MKARRIIIGLSACTIFAFALSAQEVTTSITPGSTPSMTAYAPMTDVYKKETIVPEKKPVPYAYIREADVMWAKTIWRVIDLRQRANMALRYPVSGVMSSGERYNLVGLLMKGIETEEVTPYAYQPNVGWKDPFSKITTIQEINSIKNFADSVPLGDGSAYIDYNFENVLKFEIQEQWYFDKKHSTMNVRIIGLAPVWYDMYDENNNIGLNRCKGFPSSSISPSAGGCLPPIQSTIPITMHSRSPLMTSFSSGGSPVPSSLNQM